MTALYSYQSLEDAWSSGIAEWCEAASAAAFAGAKTWMIPASDGQAHWIKRRLLSQGVSLFGIQFLDPRALRRELCQRLGAPFPVLGEETLELLLRLHLERQPDPSLLARRPLACLRALTDLAAAGWLDLHDPAPDLLPQPLLDWLPEARASDLWTPHLDRTLLHAAAPAGEPTPLTVCALGWDASRWPARDLLRAALRSADSAAVFMPLPREPAAALQRAWLTEMEEDFETESRVCPASGFRSAQASLASHLEGADLDLEPAPAPELIVGGDWADTLALVRDFVCRWLIEAEHRKSPGGEPARLAILSPRRTASGVAIVRALGQAGIEVEDGLGELTEPAPERQIQRALLAFHQDDARVDSLLTLIELLNAHLPGEGLPAPVWHAVFPLEPVETRRALQAAFGDCQHDSVRALAEVESFVRAPVAEALRALLAHLEPWPEEIPLADARRRWENELAGLGLTLEALEPHWSQESPPIEGALPSAAFFGWLGALLGRPTARRAPEGANRFARVSVTTLQNAASQVWGGAVFLDSHEGAWPLYPGENPFLDDRSRRRLNDLRGPRGCGHLLTSADAAQLEQTQLCELLENCDGPLAFAGPAHDPAEPNKELYPNEWALRCLVESARGTPQEGQLLSRWRQAVRSSAPRVGPLPAREAAALREVYARRRDPRTAFDGYAFNYQELETADELPMDAAWSARDLDDLAEGPATFALAHLFGAEPWRHGARRLARKEDWAVGRLVHRWVKASLGASREPRRFLAPDWENARGQNLRAAVARSRAGLLGRLRRDTLPLWWEGVLRKAEWAAQCCVDSLAEAAAARGDGERWVLVDKHFSARVPTPGGPLRLQALCDVTLLDRRGFAAAGCHVLDVRTGAQAPGKAITDAQAEGGAGLGLAALVLLAREEGAAAETLQVGIIHPEAANLSMLGPGAIAAFSAQLGLVAARQRLLVFGQGAGARDFQRGEDLPMATTPIDLAVLKAKAERTEALIRASPGYPSSETPLYPP